MVKDLKPEQIEIINRIVFEQIKKMQASVAKIVAETERTTVSALESASFFPKISSSHLKSITSSLDFHYDHSRTC